ncbi:hypothetical protein BJ508DRAFT_336250 [Ascobolus immersus RN42]|uniref:Uncharacterized protein n=1 Tax=Ascobolus immersus RN42 TaxID=1160509 RepID=A0A3N4H973_ASCIM|nr:hypothetical protein BJ508DRAFT_336250 [Ascobolus immersus RN42]
MPRPVRQTQKAKAEQKELRQRIRESIARREARSQKFWAKVIKRQSTKSSMSQRDIEGIERVVRARNEIDRQIELHQERMEKAAREERRRELSAIEQQYATSMGTTGLPSRNSSTESVGHSTFSASPDYAVSLVTDLDATPIIPSCRPAKAFRYCTQSAYPGPDLPSASSSSSLFKNMAPIPTLSSTPITDIRQPPSQESSSRDTISLAPLVQEDVGSRSTVHASTLAVLPGSAIKSAIKRQRCLVPKHVPRKKMLFSDSSKDAFEAVPRLPTTSASIPTCIATVVTPFTTPLPTPGSQTTINPITSASSSSTGVRRSAPHANTSRPVDTKATITVKPTAFESYSSHEITPLSSKHRSWISTDSFSAKSNISSPASLKPLPAALPDEEPRYKDTQAGNGQRLDGSPTSQKEQSSPAQSGQNTLESPTDIVIMEQGKAVGLVSSRDPLFSHGRGCRPDSIIPVMNYKVTGSVLLRRDPSGSRRLIVRKNDWDICWLVGKDEMVVKDLIKKGYKVNVRGKWVKRSQKSDEWGGKVVIWKADMTWWVDDGQSSGGSM